MKKINMQNLPSMAIRMGIGGATGIVISMIICMIVAAMVVGERIQESAMIYGAWAATGLGAVASALVGKLLGADNGFWVSVGAGVVFFLCLLCCTALFFGGQYHGVWISGLLIIGCSIAIGMIRNKKQSSHYRIKRQMR